MKLYYAPGACSLSPHIVAREAGVDVQLVKVDLKAKKTETGEDYLKINPKGYVPALQLDDGSVLTEGPAIVQYLADRAPGKHLVPAAGTAERYRQLEWLNYISTELHKQYSPLFSEATPEATRQQEFDYLTKRYAFVEKSLDGNPYLTGDTFTAADAYLFTITNWSRVVKYDLSKFPKLLAFQKRVAGRPAVQQALKAEGLTK